MKIRCLFILSLFILSCATTDKGVINRHIEKRMDSINSCFIEELRKNSDLKGDLDVRITVDGEGTVLEAFVEKSTFPDDKVPSCIIKVIKEFKFPESNQKKTFSATVPLRFHVERKSEKKEGK